MVNYESIRSKIVKTDYSKGPSTSSHSQDLKQYFMQDLSEVRTFTDEDDNLLASRVYSWIKSGFDTLEEQKEFEIENLRLVLSRAYKLLRFSSGLHPTLSLLDYVQEGYIGLNHATKNYDPKTGNSFSSYAIECIDSKIKRYMANMGKSIRIPVGKWEKIPHFIKAIRKLNEELGREPTDEEIANEMGYKLHTIKDFREAYKNCCSLDVEFDEGSRRGDLVPGKTFNEELHARKTHEKINKIYDTLMALTDIEREVIQSRYGLNGRKVQSQPEIGARLGYTKAGISAIEQRAIAKLKRPSKKRELEDLL